MESKTAPKAASKSATKAVTKKETKTPVTVTNDADDDFINADTATAQHLAETDPEKAMEQ